MTVASSAASIAAAATHSAASTDTTTTDTPPDHPPAGPDARTTTTTAISRRGAAVLAGISYVVLFALGVFANFFVREGLIVAGDAEATAANIVESEGLFRLGMLAFLVVFLLDIVVAWALHIVFRPVDHDLSLVAAWARLVYTVFLGVALIFFFQALQLLDRTEPLGGFTTEQLNAQALVALDTFNSTWLIGLAAFGAHLILLGSLMIRSGYGPKLLGAVLAIAGAAYVIDTVAHTGLADYADYETAFVTMVAIPAVIAEGWFGLWLLLRAGRDRR